MVHRDSLSLVLTDFPRTLLTDFPIQDILDHLVKRIVGVLAYLQKFPVDIVKIDQTFVLSMGQDAAASTIVSAVTQLAPDLDMTVTAEGVETEAQRDEMIDIGCDLAQGFLFAHPMSARELADQLA